MGLGTLGLSVPEGSNTVLKFYGGTFWDPPLQVQLGLI